MPTQFDEVARAQAAATADVHLAEAESARRVVAAIDREPYVALEDAIDRAEANVKRLGERLEQALEGTRTLAQRLKSAASRHTQEVERLKGELDVAQGAPTAELQSHRKVPATGGPKPLRVAELTGDARAVWKAVTAIRPDATDRRSFKASDLQVNATSNRRNLALCDLSPPRIRAALKLLESGYVQRVINPQGKAMSWSRRPVIKAAKKKGARS